jgi:hypothetical protein
VHGVATTLRYFDLPGSQPFEHGPDLESSASCAQCHGNYDSAVEPYSNWRGSMMAQASRDLLFKANMAIANQDAANSGDLCLRCHLARGWLAGRSVPTDGSRMEAADGDGVSCALCHRMTDPVYTAGVSPTNDLAVLAALSFPGTNYGNGMFVIDPTGLRRGPYRLVLGLVARVAFHRAAAFRRTCHDGATRRYEGRQNYQPNTFDAASLRSAAFHGAVERTYSEWLASDYNIIGVHARNSGQRPRDGVHLPTLSCGTRAHMQHNPAVAARIGTRPDGWHHVGGALRTRTRPSGCHAIQAGEPRDAASDQRVDDLTDGGRE